MHRLLAAVLFSVIVTAAPAAIAQNRIVLLEPQDARNVAAVTIEGDGNRLEIAQEATGSGAGNAIKVSITGDLNGGPLGSTFNPVVASRGLAPGSLTQRGFGNSIDVSVVGNANLFAFSQTGSGNMISASIRGHDNQAAVIQHGNGNHASFSQNGIGNSVSISQISW